MKNGIHILRELHILQLLINIHPLDVDICRDERKLLAALTCLEWSSSGAVCRPVLVLRLAERCQLIWRPERKKERDIKVFVCRQWRQDSRNDDVETKNVEMILEQPWTSNKYQSSAFQDLITTN